MRVAAAGRRYERAAALRRRAQRLRTILERIDGALAATHAHPRLVLASHPTQPRCDALWLAGGRLVEFCELPADLAECERQCSRAIARAGRAGELGAYVPPAEIDELRIIAAYLATHPDTPELSLEPAPTRAALAAFVDQAKGSSTISPSAGAAPAVTSAPTGASRLISASAIGPKRGELAALVTRPTERPS